VSEQDRSNEAVVSLLAGLGVGLLIGASTALLLAPQSGAETRSYLGDTAHDVLGKVRDSIDDVRVKLDEVIVQTRQALSRTQGSTGPGPELPTSGEALASPPTS
jgi:gas vesicle protein